MILDPRIKIADKIKISGDFDVIYVLSLIMVDMDNFCLHLNNFERNVKTYCGKKFKFQPNDPSL